MAAKKKATAKKKAGLAKRKPAGGLTKYDYGDDAGAGYENTSQSDFAIPFLGVLQTNSPQCEKQQDQYMEEAEPGNLYNTVSRELIDGEEGVVLVPCDTSHVFTEWVPRDKGGGFRGVHEVGSDLVKACKAAATSGVGKLATDEETELIETFYIFALRLAAVDSVEPMEFVMVPFTSTKIKKYKQIMYRLRMFKGNPPLFAHRILLKSVPDKNAKGSFYNFDVVPAVDEDVGSSLINPAGDQGELLEAAKQFQEQIRSGAARGAYETADGGSDEPSADKHF